jgi:hypothetical protein
MSFRDRLPNIAIGFGIGVVIALVAAWALHDYQRGAECKYYSAEPHCQDASNVSPSVRVSTISAEKGPNPDPYPERKEWREEQDLKAQRDQAYWAWGAMVAALMAVGVTSIGVVLLWFTLGHTRDAAESARAMVIESEKATAAVVAGAQEAKRIGEAQARAYLAIELRGGILRDTIHNTQPHVVGNLENTGNTPASNVDFTIYVEFFRLPNEALLKVEGKQRIPHLTPKIKDHNFRIYMESLTFSDDHLEMIARQEVRMTVTVTMSFVDAFERLQNSGPIGFWGAPEMTSPTRMNCSLGIRL